MNTKKHIADEVDKTLAALDGINRQQTDPFFETRLQARIEKRREHKTGFRFALIPSMQLAFVIALVFINVVSIAIFTLSTDTMQVSDQAVESFMTDNNMEQSMELLVDLNE